MTKFNDFLTVKDLKFDISKLQESLKEVLKSLVTGRDSKEIMNFIDSNPKLFYSVVLSAHKEKRKQKEIMEIVIINLHKIIANTKSINKKKKS